MFKILENKLEKTQDRRWRMTLFVTFKMVYFRIFWLYFLPIVVSQIYDMTKICQILSFYSLITFQSVDTSHNTRLYYITVLENMLMLAEWVATLNIYIYKNMYIMYSLYLHQSEGKII